MVRYKRGGVIIAHTKASLPTKKRILTVCAKLFLEKGYKGTTIAEITEKAKVSASSFQNIFGAKDGVLTEVVPFMFAQQFGMARKIVGADLPGTCVYALETAIQLTLTELNENLRELYVEAYTQEEAYRFIRESMARELFSLFGPYQPELTQEDFYAMDIGSSGMMRSYMAYPCKEGFSLERKVQTFLSMSLSAYHVPQREQEQIIAFISQLNLRQISQKVMDELFQALAIHYEFSL